MADTVSKAIRNKTMRAIKAEDTKLENTVICELSRHGCRFRKNVKDLYGKPDLAIKKYKIAIFIDSCFWHGCPYHCRMPHSNKNYWNAKIERNKKRDKDVNLWFKKNEWLMLRFWEHKINSNLDECIKEIQDCLEKLKKKKSENGRYTVELAKRQFSRSIGWGVCH